MPREMYSDEEAPEQLPGAPVASSDSLLAILDAFLRTKQADAQLSVCACCVWLFSLALSSL